jgi:hypothetical protein
MAIADLVERIMAVPVPSGSTSSIHGGTAETRAITGGSTRFHRFHHKNDKPEKKQEIEREGRDLMNMSYFANCGGTDGTEAMATRQLETARCWRVAFADGEQLTAMCSPEATCEEVMAMYPSARVEPFTWPVRKPDAPLTAGEKATIWAWLALIEETDPASIASTIEQCQQDREARAYFLGRAAVELPKPTIEEKEP